MLSWILITTATSVLLLPRVLSPRERARATEFRGVLRLLRSLNATYCRFWHALEADRAAPLPVEGPAILVSNHTCNIDHMLLQACSDRLLGFMIAREFYEAPWANAFCKLAGCIPVRRDGKDLAATRAALRALESGRVLPIFPEGKITPESGSTIGPAKPGAAFIAARARVPIIPAYIVGTPRTNNLVRAVLTPSRARVYFGDPIEFEFDDSSAAEPRSDKEGLAELSNLLMDAIHKLKIKHERSFD